HKFRNLGSATAAAMMMLRLKECCVHASSQPPHLPLQKDGLARTLTSVGPSLFLSVGQSMGPWLLAYASFATDLAANAFPRHGRPSMRRAGRFPVLSPAPQRETERDNYFIGQECGMFRRFGPSKAHGPAPKTQMPPGQAPSGICFVLRCNTNQFNTSIKPRFSS
ncbi:MAG: hypothetical protein ACP5EP_10165, partial [Acidobacteriaceae bacterium]